MPIHVPNIRSRRARRGTAATELAVCLPIVLVLIVGTIEACSMVYLKQSLSVAAYEGVRVSVSPNGDATAVTTAANRILTARNVISPTITVSPANFANQPAGTWVSVHVTAPANANSIISGFFYDAIVVDGQATMMKEF
ncbi:MAG TPA: pilus assembly protein [Planctomycetes bacterium]|nr:pilus assembly protein [Fuerstiella sp.]HIK90515.1 pilus assembly protein [Planctomycetota bacterium]